MDIGDDLISTLTVPTGDATTAATYVAIRPDGTTESGSGTAVGGFTTWQATIPMTAQGWGLTTWTVTGAGAGVQRSRWFVARTATAWGVWPPTLTDLKTDMSRDDQKDATDAQLEQVLSAAIEWVTGRKRGVINFHEGDESESGLSDPSYSLILGTVRLAGRWHIRRRSADGFVSFGELGAQQVPGYDPDIDKLLGLGRSAGLRFA